MRLKKIVNWFWGKEALRAPLIAASIIMSLLIISLAQVFINQV